MQTDLINALNRLERAGNENSRTTLKMREAAVKVADEIISNFSGDLELPRGYCAIRQYSGAGSFRQLRNESHETLNSESKIPGEHYLHGDYNRTWRNVGREGLQKFAADIAGGLLDEIAEFLEERAAQNEGAAAILESKGGEQNS